jgi:hypothetical protein
MNLTGHVTVLNFGRGRQASYQNLEYLFNKYHMERVNFEDENGDRRQGILTQLLPGGVFVIETMDPQTRDVQEHDVHGQDIEW